MRKVLFALAPALLIFFVFTRLVEARSGCCSHHGGVCGCGCCDGTSLSNTCAPYYPECSQPVYRAPVATLRPSTPKPATPKPTVKPISTPTFEPTPIPTEVSTSSPVSEVKGIQTFSTPTPEPLTAGQTAVSLLVLGAGSFGIWKFLKFLGRK